MSKYKSRMKAEKRTARPDRLVSLYLTLMSAAVSRMASMASSRVTLYTPSLAIDSCAAVTALTATVSHEEILEQGRNWRLPPRLFRS